MSILIAGAEGELARSVVRRLVAQGDEVRVIEPDVRRAQEWKALGAHTAVGSGGDSELVERAAQDVRTVVVLHADKHPAMLAAVGEGARLGTHGDEDLRLIVVATELREAVRDAARSSGLDYVLLATGPSAGRGARKAAQRWWRRRHALAAQRIAAAIDAADDLSGHPQLELDLRTRRAWEVLGIEAEEAGSGG